MRELNLQRAYQPTKRSLLDCGESKTEQSHKKECDMNYILREYSKTGFIRHSKENEGRYDDVGVQDFQQAMLVVANANSMFESLPA